MIYLDHHAATPTCEAALSAMHEARGAGWANPSSTHSAGRRARALVEAARERLARSIGARPADLVLTAGGTEACNLGVMGVGAPAARVVTSTVEHPAVARAVERLERSGAPVTRLEVPDGATPSADELAGHLADGVRTLVAVQWVNHETGTVFPVREYARACRSQGALLFVDATQALGKLEVDVESLGADAVAFASHKIGGPAGAGALWVRRGLEVEPVLAGGSQERGRRPGTPDVIAQVGFGAACEAVPDRLACMPRLGALRDRLERFLVERGAVVNGAARRRVATVTDVSVPGWKGPVLAAALDVEGVCVSSGAACSSALVERSPVVAAMYPGDAWRAEATLRLSLGPETNTREVAAAEAVLERVLARNSEPEARA